MSIALFELMNKGGLNLKLNIIGSDLDRASLEVARTGIYPESITVVLRPELLARYFIRSSDGQFQTRKMLREAVLFSQHNLLADPPFSACSSAEATCKGYDHELRLRKADGSYHWMHFVGEPRFERKRLAGFVGSSVDIQYHKDAEEQLRNADQRKDEFLAILGHELRNPVSPIRNAAQALKFVDSGDKRLLWARETITRQVDHMTRLVDDLLDIARLTRDTLTLRKEAVEMSVIIHHAVESTKALIDSYKHHLTVAITNEPLFVSGDPVRLTQIVENLLTNAAKFTEEGGEISLDARHEGHELVMSVRDNGIGMPQQCYPRFLSFSCWKNAL